MEIKNENTPENFNDFFKNNQKLAKSKIEDFLLNRAKIFLDESFNDKISNVVLFDYLDEIREDLPDYWGNNILKELELSYKSVFNRKISHQATETSVKIIRTGLEKAIDQITKQILRWSLDLTIDDLFKLAHLTIQNIKSSIRKGINIIQDSVISDSF